MGYLITQPTLDFNAPALIEIAPALPDKALSIRQPWAWAILYAGKDIENRDWPAALRGRVAIHAAKRMTREEYEDAVDFMNRRCGIPLSEIPSASELVGGAILGSVEIVDCVTSSNSPWFVGEYGFVLRNPVVFDLPIECSGALGFWNVPKPRAKAA